MNSEAPDSCSYSNINNFRTQHLHWVISVDFASHILTCNAQLKVQCIQAGCEELVLDTKGLDIESITLDDDNVQYSLLKDVGEFGQALHIVLPAEKCIAEQVFTISMQYKTSPNATAVQWLQAEQTLGKKHPYMYTQCEAIHARSLLPCQDSPSCKFTYAAQLTVPKELVALMSAVKGDTNSLGDDKCTCCFEQKIPVPAYLIAIAVGALQFETVGPRSKVWCEKEMIAACKFEFCKVEDMLQTAESLMGPYLWGVYDLLILPPSFPLGGMENPCLTFVTPTIITGDRSLTNVVVHEITHSWTGNLVTNRTWEHFWLNEGFTRFIEDKIIGLLEGDPMRHFMGIDGWHTLTDEIEHFGATNKLTSLIPDLIGSSPDDAFSSVPYEKGSSFLFYIESLVGGPCVFNPFLRSYIEHFKFQAIVTDDFKEYLLEYFKYQSEALRKIDWDAWLHSPGMPPVNILEMYDQTLADSCNELCRQWIDALPHKVDTFREEDFSLFTTAQKINFLSKLFQEKSFELERLKSMAELYKLPTIQVSEIEFAFLRLCIRAQWSDMYDNVVRFVTKQGRMKFVRPLYREMFKHEGTKQLAVETFQRNKHVYHNLATMMLVKDLQLVE